MGYDAACTLIFDGKTFRGTAILEQNDLRFRGDVRLIIPLKGIREIQAQDGRLIVTFGGRTAIFELGERAEKWADRIANPPARLQKLGLKDGMRIAVINVDDAALVEESGACGATIESGSKAELLDMIFFGARSAADLDRLRTLAARIKPDGAIWLIRAKGRGAPIRESESMAAGKRAGLVDVKVVSFSQTHSAEKYVIPVAQRARSRRSASAAPGRRESASSRDRT